MWIAVTVIAIVCVALIIVVRLALVGRRPVHEPQPEVVDPADAADEFPQPGEPSPRRTDGSAVPGSRAHRDQHREHHAQHDNPVEHPDRAERIDPPG
jgi:hypothetical protein